jgi:hypothetical protein
MQGILETPGPTVPGNLEHGQVKEAPSDGHTVHETAAVKRSQISAKSNYKTWKLFYPSQVFSYINNN